MLQIVRVTVLGAGVVGIVTAWYLARKGHAVTVIERSDSVASGTSFANAGQLSWSFTDALARPAFLRRLPFLLFNRDPGILVRTAFRGSFAHWGVAFMRQCTAARARENTVAVLKLGMRSCALMDELIAEVPLDFSRRRAGKLVLLSGVRELAAARAAVALKRGHGCITDLLSREEAIAVEPALARLEDDFLAAVHSAGDEVADARAFTAGLAAWLEANTPTRILLGEPAASIVVRNGAAAGVATPAGEHSADAVVVCLGCDSPSLLEPLGIRVPICPVRGYSVTLPAASGTPSTSVTHTKHRLVFSRLGDAARIAGFADFVGRDTAGDASRIEALIELARRIAPQAAEYDAAARNPWGGFRPMTPDSRPVVGPTRVRGLHLNTGHGMLGWTLACATGHAVAETIA